MSRASPQIGRFPAWPRYALDIPAGVPEALAHAVTGRYRIERELGRGGMATVYLAQDLRHDRPVALKFLRPDLAAAIGAERFLAEIHTTARLAHPNILPLFDSGVVELGGETRDASGGSRVPSPATVLYYVMPYVAGESLKERLARTGPLPLDEVRALLADVASALDYAHRQGVIHRDLKPANILLQDGKALLADFGIARVASSSPGGERLTETGLSVGTPHYMSPEQASGEREVGPASDQYSLAVVAYEALTGRIPFDVPSFPAMLVQLLTAAPPPLTQSRPGLPDSVNTAVLRALAKDPTGRFRNCETFRAAIGGGPESDSTPVPAAPARPRMRRWPLLVGGAVGLSALLVTWLVTREPAATAAPAPQLLAVLPFVNLSGDTTREYFSRGLAVEITEELHRLGINVVGSAAITAAARRFTSGPDVDVQAAGQSVGADAVLGGTLQSSAGGGRVNLELTDVRTQRVLWTEQYTLDADLFAMQDSVARAVARSLRVTLHPSDLAAVRRGRSVDPAAHDQVVRAKGYADRRDPAGLDQAIPLFTEAIRRDSTYAEAWAGLAEAYFLRAVFSDAGFGNVVDHGEYFRRSAVAAARALTLDSTSAAVHRVLGMLAVFHTHEWDVAKREFQASVERDSTQAATWLFRTWYYYGMDQRDSAVWSVRRAWALDSLTTIYPTRLADVLRDFGDVADARRLLDRTVRRNPTDLISRIAYAALLAADGRCDSALAMPVPSLSSSPGAQQQLEVWARCGRTDLVRTSLDSADAAVRRGQWAHGIFMAMGAAMIGDTARMERWLDYSVIAHDYTAFFLRAPAFDAYHENPHYRAALAGLGLE